MKYVFSMILLASCALAFYLAIIVYRQNEKMNYENRLLSLLCISSAVWNFGFGGLILQTNVETAYIWRAVGMVGVFAYLIIAQILLCHLTTFQSRVRLIFNIIAFLGIPIYFFIIQKNLSIYYLDDTIGMTYQFKAGFWNNIYIIYTVLAAVNMMVFNLNMIFCSNLKRMKVVGSRLVCVELIIFAGTILDTILPIFGYHAIPGSSLTQFLGLVVLYNAIQYMNRFRIDISNMSQFVYSSLAIPLLAFDSRKNLQLVNDTADVFLKGVRKRMERENIRLGNIFNVKEEEAFAFSDGRADIDAICVYNKVYCNLSISRVKDDFGDCVGYIIIVTDMTEHRNTMKKLEKAMHDAENANRAKSTFLANMSHEIRTPMNAIIGFSELLLKMEGTPEIKDYVTDINRSAHNLLAIINDILDLSKIESGKMELVLESYYMTTLLNDVSLIISSQAKKKGLTFHIEADDNIPNQLYGDKVRLRGILINILNNAIKYTHKGSVRFDIHVVKKDEQSVTLQFKVTDTGIGIREEEKKDIFKSFSQFDQKVNYGVEGSGLGLAIVKGYVTLMGGDITVDSVYGEGSVFTITVEQKILDQRPIAKTYMIDEDRYKGNSIGNLKIHGVRVLVVDDNHINLKVATSTMKYYGLDVDVAASGMEAIELCQKNHYTIIFMDQMMPEMDGIEAMKRIRKLDPFYDHGGGCKIIVLTADAILGVRDRLLKEGFDEYLGKPINFKRLERVLARSVPPETVEYVDENESAAGESEKPGDILRLKEMLPNVDVADGIGHCGGNWKDYLDVLKVTLNYGEKQLKELTVLKEEKDYENYIIKIHSMKSTTKNIGANDLSEMAKNQEKAGKSGDFSYIDRNLEVFAKEYRILLGHIEEVLKYYNLLENVKEEQLSQDVVPLVLQNIRNCLDAFNFARIFEILEEVKKYRLKEEDQELFSKITEKMNDLDVDGVLEMIQKAEDKGK